MKILLTCVNTVTSFRFDVWCKFHDINNKGEYKLIVITVIIFFFISRNRPQISSVTHGNVFFLQLDRLPAICSWTGYLPYCTVTRSLRVRPRKRRMEPVKSLNPQRSLAESNPSSEVSIHVAKLTVARTVIIITAFFIAPRIRPTHVLAAHVTM